MTETKWEQHDRLSNEVCPVSDKPEWSGPPTNHGLIAVTSRSWRDWFRKRRFWRCWFCDLREEMGWDDSQSTLALPVKFVCTHNNPLCDKFGCPDDPEWRGDRR